MNKHKLCALLLGVAILSVGSFSSCKSDDNELETRIRTLETKWADLESSLGKAVTDGLRSVFG